MISYRFKRRAFLTAIGGGVGLKIMLRNMEASAQTSKSPGGCSCQALAGRHRRGRRTTLFTATSGSNGAGR